MFSRFHNDTTITKHKNKKMLALGGMKSELTLWPTLSCTALMGSVELLGGDRTCGVEAKLVRSTLGRDNDMGSTQATVACGALRKAL